VPFGLAVSQGVNDDGCVIGGSAPGINNTVKMEFKNIYRKPRHVAGGEVETFLRFMARLIPDERERNWLFDWMAHKLRHPHVPGTAVVFVADTEDDIREGEFGTGRGFLFRTTHQLYGEQYTSTQSFSMLDGSSAQSGFTDWMHGCVLVTVDESRTSPTAYRRGERSAAYEVLKDLVDPAPKRMNFKVKFGRAFDDWSYPLQSTYIRYQPGGQNGMLADEVNENPLDRTAFVSSLSPETGLALDPDPSEKDILVVVKLDEEGFPIPDANGNPIIPARSPSATGARSRPADRCSFLPSCQDTRHCPFPLHLPPNAARSYLTVRPMNPHAARSRTWPRHSRRHRCWHAR
jgi:hypothetical protein